MEVADDKGNEIGPCGAGHHGRKGSDLEAAASGERLFAGTLMTGKYLQYDH